MDTNQPNDTSSQNGPVIASDQQPVQRQSQQSPPTILPGGKEAAPLSTARGEVSDYAEPAAHESVPELPQEVESAGVEVVEQPQDIKLTDEQQKAGIQAAAEATPMPTDTQGSISSPWTVQQAEQAAGGKAGNSSTWLGKLILFAFGQKQHNKDTF